MIMAPNIQICRLDQVEKNSRSDPFMENLYSYFERWHLGSRSSKLQLKLEQFKSSLKPNSCFKSLRNEDYYYTIK